MNCIAIDASTQNLGLCVAELSSNGVVERHAEQNMATGGYSSRKIPLLLQNLLSEVGFKTAEADFIAVTKGPGSFTGLRVGLAVAKGLSLGLNVPVVSVGTGALLTFSFADTPLPVLGLLDIRMGRYFGALSYNSKYHEITDVESGDLLEFLSTRLGRSKRPVFLTGPDAAALRPSIAASFATVLDPLYGRGRGLPLVLLGYERFSKGLFEEAGASPIYGRDPAIGTTRPRR